MGVHALFELVVDRPDRQVLLESAEGSFGIVPGSRLVAVATPTRLGSFESEMARQRVPSGTQAVPLSKTTLERLAAALGFAPLAAGRFLAAEPLLRGHVEALRGVWIRRLER